MSAVSAWPQLGVGLSYRTQLHRDLIAHADALDCLEILVEDLMAVPDRLDDVDSLVRDRPILAHGVSFSLGSPEPIPPTLLARLRRVVRRTHAQWLSEHLAFTRLGSIDLPAFTPVPFAEDSIATIRQNAETLRRSTGVPIVLEPIAYPFVPLGSHLSELEFVRRILESSPFGLLLDLTNLFINASNHAYDPYEFIDGLPLERIAQVHLAGCSRSRGLVVDSHDAPIPEEVWKLLAFLASRYAIPSVIIEREGNFPAIQQLIEEVQRARSTCRTGRPRPSSPVGWIG